MGRNTTEIDRGAAAQRKLLELTHKRLERFVTLVPKFLVNDDPETIHDLRVWSRRLQQTLRTILGEKTPGSRKAIRMLRRLRRALGDCRNLDVNFALVQQRVRGAPSAVLRGGWEELRRHLKQSRAAPLAAARKDIVKYDLIAFIKRAGKLIAHADRDADPTAKLAAAVANSRVEWDEAFGLAQQSRKTRNLHSLRIATKRLRYRAEILADSGSSSLRVMVKDLQKIQAALGDWHDRSVLVQYAEEFLARRDFSEQHPDMGGALLAELEKENQRNDEASETLLHRAAKLRRRWNNHSAQDKQRPHLR